MLPPALLRGFDPCRAVAGCEIWYDPASPIPISTTTADGAGDRIDKLANRISGNLQAQRMGGGVYSPKIAFDTRTGRRYADNTVTTSPGSSGLGVGASSELSGKSFTAGSGIVCLNKSGDADGNGFWTGFGSSGSSSHHRFSDNNVYDDFCSTARKNTNPGTSFAGRHIYMVRSKASQWDAWLDGTRFLNTTSNTVGFGATPRVSVGTSAVDIYEFFFFSRYISDGEMGLIGDYLAGKWGISTWVPVAG